MKIAIAQLNYHIGHFEGNLAIMLRAIDKAKKAEADIILFSEMATCGYPPRDFLEFKDFFHKSNAVIYELCQHSKEIAIVVGAPTANPELEGKDLYNSAFFLYDQKVQYIAKKALLPNYDIFDEYRYFEPNKSFELVEFKGKKIAITICEDIWNLGNENPMYTICPLDELMNQHPDFILNLSASPFDIEHTEDRIDVIRANVSKYKIPLFYANCYGAQTDILFDGGSMVMSPDGMVYDELPFFKEGFGVYDLDVVIKGGIHVEQKKLRIELVYQALLMGIKDYFAKLGLQKAILGLSGGIDSALTCVLAVHALGKDNVKGLMMPSQYSSEGSVTDSQLLANNLGIDFEIISIKEIFEKYQQSLAPFFKDKKEDVTEENLQARIRGMILMAFCNKFGYVLLNTTNKSEMSVGYGTLYGDLCGGIAVLADVYKLMVYELANYINLHIENVIPQNTIDKTPSAELKPGQKDSDSLPEYSVLDKILYYYIEQRKGPEEIIDKGFDRALVLRVLRMVNRAEFKRFQAPPVLRISIKAFGLGRRLPIEGKYLD